MWNEKSNFYPVLSKLEFVLVQNQQFQSNINILIVSYQQPNLWTPLRVFQNTVTHAAVPWLLILLFSISCRSRRSPQKVSLSKMPSSDCLRICEIWWKTFNSFQECIFNIVTMWLWRQPVTSGRAWLTLRMLFCVRHIPGGFT